MGLDNVCHFQIILDWIATLFQTQIFFTYWVEKTRVSFMCLSNDWSQDCYLDIRRVPLAVPPWAADARETSFWMVKLVLVSVKEECGEGLLQEQEEWIHLKGSLRCQLCVYWAAEGYKFVSVWSRYSLSWASTSVLNERWSKGSCSGEEACRRRPTSRSARRRTLLAWDWVRRSAAEEQREILRLKSWTHAGAFLENSLCLSNKSP